MYNTLWPLHAAVPWQIQINMSCCAKPLLRCASILGLGNPIMGVNFVILQILPQFELLDYVDPCAH